MGRRTGQMRHIAGTDIKALLSEHGWISRRPSAPGTSAGMQMTTSFCTWPWQAPATRRCGPPVRQAPPRRPSASIDRPAVTKVIPAPTLTAATTLGRRDSQFDNRAAKLASTAKMIAVNTAKMAP